MTFNFLNFLKRSRKLKDFLVLRINSSEAQGLIVKKSERNFYVSNFSSERFDRFGVFQSRDFERDLLKHTIEKILKGLSLEKGALPGIFLNPSPEVFKGRIAKIDYERKNPKREISQKEKKTIIDSVLSQGEKKAKEEAGNVLGCPVNEFQTLERKIVERKISGYPVNDILGHKGKFFEFRVLTLFLFKNISGILYDLEEILDSRDFRIIHPAQGLISWLSGRNNFSGMFVEIGPNFSQVFLIEKGIFKWMTEIDLGGNIFNRALSEQLGLSDREAENLKERFGDKKFSRGTGKIVEEILSKPLTTWFSRLKKELKHAQYEFHFVFPGEIYLFGQSSLLLIIKKILRRGDWDHLVILESPKVSFLSPRDLPIKDKSGLLKGSQETGISLLSLVLKEND
jgi:hypothetical protein